jgi:5-methyltetrahydrofolate corrinoid/iron sulfur protein methyltransferase
MYIIGENIHIISEKVKEALTNRDREFFMDLAVKQVEAGAKCVDINLGPRKKDFAEVWPWIIETVETVVDVPLSIDTTNVDGMEAALKSIKKAQPILNSTSAEPGEHTARPLPEDRTSVRRRLTVSGRPVPIRGSAGPDRT